MNALLLAAQLRAIEIHFFHCVYMGVDVFFFSILKERILADFVTLDHLGSRLEFWRFASSFPSVDLSVCKGEGSTG